MDLIEKVSKEVRANHRKILDDWCKAYLAQLYEESGEVKPGNYTLCQQELHEYKGKLVQKYWFEKK